MLLETSIPEGDRVWRPDAGHSSPSAVISAAGVGWYLPVKTIAEFVLALAMLLLASPVIALAAVLVRLTSRGPAFYSQTRLGLHGRPYKILKIRTMFHDCERLKGAQWSTQNDPRVTAVGRWLRRTHVDELPQLWNVLRGEMSLVGPRPERPEFVPKLAEAIPHYRDRLHVRPGLTGLAQVQLPPDTDLESVRRKLAYDLYYVRAVGPVLDLRILIGTVYHVLGMSAQKAPWILRVPGGEKIERAYEDLAATPAPVVHLQPA